MRSDPRVTAPLDPHTTQSSASGPPLGGSSGATGADVRGSEGPPGAPDDPLRNPHRGSIGQRVADMEESLEHRLDTVVDAVKPRLRGWLHLGTFPASVAAGILLVALAPSTLARVSSAIFATTAMLLFGVSALYHRGRWSPRVTQFLKRLDHANIYLIIAGTYTPFTALLLPAGAARTLLWTVWGGAVAGVLLQVVWPTAPRWLNAPVYVALGWVAVAYLPDFLRGGGAGILALIVLGGALYTVGGIVYGMKWPDPSPRWFGFHEVFHALTVVAFAVHYAGVSLAVYTST